MISNKNIKNINVNDNSEYIKQQKFELDIIKDGDKYYKVINRNRNKYLYLGPNEVFFNNNIGSLIMVDKKQSDDELNQNKTYGYITNIYKDSVMYWPIYLEKKCKDIKLYCKMNINPSNKNSVLSLIIDGKFKQKIELNYDNHNKEYVFSCKINVLGKGFHSIELLVYDMYNKYIGLGRFFYIRFKSFGKIHIVRERWIPPKIVTKFDNDTFHQIDAWVMSFKGIENCEVSIKTPFGYCEIVNGKKMNFGFNNKLSRILSVGFPTGNFNDFEPWSVGNNGIYTISLKFEINDNIYTFYLYYWNVENKEWCLYGICKTQMESSLLSLLPIECTIKVDGLSDKSRSNHIRRVITCNGFVRSKAGILGNWHKINKMTTEQSMGGYSSKSWDISNNGDFIISTGGLENWKMSSDEKYFEINSDRTFEYMDEDKMNIIDTEMVFPKILSHKIDKNNNISIKISIPFKAGSNNNDVIIYTGKNDELSIANRWDNSVGVGDISYGESELVVKNVNNCKFMRLLVKDNVSQTWSYETYRL